MPDPGHHLRDEDLLKPGFLPTRGGPVVHVVPEPRPRLHVPVVGNLHERRRLLHAHRPHVCAPAPSGGSTLVVVAAESDPGGDARSLRPHPAEEVLPARALAQDVELPELLQDALVVPIRSEVRVAEGVVLHDDHVNRGEHLRVGDEQRAPAPHARTTLPAPHALLVEPVVVIPELDRGSDHERAREHEPTRVLNHGGQRLDRAPPLKIVQLGLRDRAAVLVIQRARGHLEREHHEQAGDVDVASLPRLAGCGECVKVDEVRKGPGKDDVAATLAIDHHGGVGEDTEDRAGVRGRSKREHAQQDACDSPRGRG